MKEAEEAKKKFEIVDESNNMVGLKYYDNAKTTEENEDANANFSYNDEKKEGTIVVSFTDNSQYNKKYKLHTSVSSELILYGVDPLPKVTSVSTTDNQYSNTNNTVTLNWSGNAKMNELEKMDIYIIEDSNSDTDGGTPVASFDKNVISQQTATITLPDTLQSGKYYIRAVYNKEDVTAGIVNTTTSFDYSNSTQPAKVSGITVSNVGDLQLKARIDASADDKCEGAQFTLYEVKENGEKTELPNYSATATRNEENEIYAVLGGNSESSVTNENGKTTTTTEGLKANGKYVVSVKPFNMLKDSEENVVGLTYGEESFSDEITLNEPKKATITLSADKRKYQVERVENAKDENDNVVEKTVMYDTYASSAINFTASADMKVSGTWQLDSDEEVTGTFTDATQVPIAFSNLPDGDHTLTIEGKNENGDGFMESFVFNIDTAAPTLLLTSPVNGSGFEEDGKLTISGITENDAYLSVMVDGNPVIRSKTLKDINAVMGEDGDFTFDVNIGKGYYKKNVEVIVSDEIGNAEKVRCDVYNNGLGNVKELDVALSADTTGNTEKEWVSYSGKNLFLNKNADTSVALQLSAITNDNNVIVLNDMENVSWNVDSVLGSADINDGKLTIEKDSHGFVEGKLMLVDGAAMSESFTFGAEAQGMKEEEGFKVLYDANGGQGAMTDPNSPYSKNDSVLVAECGFTNGTRKFVGWNTKADGSGTTYIPGDRFYIKDNVTLYAIWGAEQQKPEPTTISDAGTGDSSSVRIGSTHTIKKAKYKVTSSNKVTYMGTTDKKSKKITIPNTVVIKGKTYKVTAVGGNVCKVNKKVTQVIIGKNVTVIAPKAFYKKKTLKSIIFKSVKISKIGKNAFKGINKKAIFKVPKKAKKKYKSKLNKTSGYVKKTMKIK